MCHSAAAMTGSQWSALVCFCTISLSSSTLKESISFKRLRNNLSLLRIYAKEPRLGRRRAVQKHIMIDIFKYWVREWGRGELSSQWAHGTSGYWQEQQKSRIRNRSGPSAHAAEGILPGFLATEKGAKSHICRSVSEGVICWIILSLLSVT